MGHSLSPRADCRFCCPCYLYGSPVGVQGLLFVALELASLRACLGPTQERLSRPAICIAQWLTKAAICGVLHQFSPVFVAPMLVDIEQECQQGDAKESSKENSQHVSYGKTGILIPVWGKLFKRPGPQKELKTSPTAGSAPSLCRGAGRPTVPSPDTEHPCEFPKWAGWRLLGGLWAGGRSWSIDSPPSSQISVDQAPRMQNMMGNLVRIRGAQKQAQQPAGDGSRFIMCLAHKRPRD